MELEDQEELVLASIPTKRRKWLDKLPLFDRIVDEVVGVLRVNQG